ncbi:MAG: cation:proton antiporter [Bacilli bacterium]|jgi:Kef-type K+ transport system membrane component KefB
METAISIFSVIGILLLAYSLGKVLSLIKLPAILGYLIAGMIFGPHLVNLVSQTTIDSIPYNIIISLLEALAGVMIGSEMVYKKLKSYGKQILVTTLFQSLGTFVVVSVIFLITFAITKTPWYLAFIFGGIALATAPAPALSIVDQYKTDGPVTRTLIPMAALDDVVGIIVFFTVISIVSASLGEGSTPVYLIVLMILFPFIIGIPIGFLGGFLIKKIKNDWVGFAVYVLSLLVAGVLGLVIDKYVYGSFSLNYLLIGMSVSLVIANMIPGEKHNLILKRFAPILTISLLTVIVNLGMPLDYKYIAGAGVFCAVYILSRALGKIGGAYIGSRVTKAQPTVRKYLGLTLLPHSGVSLIFTGIAVGILSGPDPESAAIIQGTIAAAAIINEIIAVILSKEAFKWAGELNKKGTIIDANTSTNEVMQPKAN